MDFFNKPLAMSCPPHSQTLSGNDSLLETPFRQTRNVTDPHKAQNGVFRPGNLDVYRTTTSRLLYPLLQRDDASIWKQVRRMAIAFFALSLIICNFLII